MSYLTRQRIQLAGLGRLASWFWSRSNGYVPASCPINAQGE